ncbi:hypothetical protein CYMTET_16042 [Cymbomonas tetramitiformis]|uniref:Protein LOW PSII ACCUMULATION 1, chloroplastic n=1 Tax=Cymbomonas tetramitiformis TaxID=36881 RepID=A0AAE0GDB8_9CHLO|nr:hypothetical protein CYMTET_16042 [Cymbomonas tetramitiformis]
MKQQGAQLKSALAVRGPPIQCRRTSQGAIKRVPMVVTANVVEDTVNAGLKFFDEGKYSDALKKFDAAEELKPTDIEMQAVTFNRACVYVKLGNFKSASADLKKAVNDYDLRYQTVLKDDDLEPLRQSPLFEDLVSELKGISAVDTDESQVRMRAELKSPFRFIRLSLAGGLAVGATVGLLITIPQLILALQGGEGAPRLSETAKNLGINLGGLLVLGTLVYRDLKQRDKEEDTMRRFEELGKLQVKKQNGKEPIPLNRFRFMSRPILVAGSEKHVKRTLKSAAAFKQDLIERGVIIVGIVIEEKKDSPKIDLGFGKQGPAGKPSGETVAPLLTDAGTAKDRFMLDAVNLPQWEGWLKRQTEEAGVELAKGVYLSIGLDGSVRASGKGAPTWDNLVRDLEPVDSWRSKFTQT